MKKITAIILILLSLDVRSQKIYVQGGVNFANITNSSEGHTEKDNMLTTFNVGVMTRIKLPGITGIETGLLLSGRGAKAETYFPSTGADEITLVKSTFNPIYLEVPVNLCIGIPMGIGPSLFVNAGPYIAMGLAGKSKVDTYGGIAGTIHTERKIDFRNEGLVFQQEEASYNQLKKFDYGINLGIGVNFKKLILKANYGFGLANINATQSLTNINDNNKYRTFSLSAGIPLRK